MKKNLKLIILLYSFISASYVFALQATITNINNYRVLKDYSCLLSDEKCFSMEKINELYNEEYKYLTITTGDFQGNKNCSNVTLQEGCYTDAYGNSYRTYHSPISTTAKIGNFYEKISVFLEENKANFDNYTEMKTLLNNKKVDLILAQAFLKKTIKDRDTKNRCNPKTEFFQVSKKVPTGCKANEIKLYFSE